MYVHDEFRSGVLDIRRYIHIKYSLSLSLSLVSVEFLQHHHCSTLPIGYSLFLCSNFDAVYFFFLMKIYAFFSFHTIFFLSLAFCCLQELLLLSLFELRLCRWRCNFKSNGNDLSGYIFCKRIYLHANQDTLVYVSRCRTLEVNTSDCYVSTEKQNYSRNISRLFEYH